jgi:hypothetical protein
MLLTSQRVKDGMLYLEPSRNPGTLSVTEFQRLGNGDAERLFEQ